MTNYVLGFITNEELVTANTNLLLLKRKDKPHKGLFNGLGGHIEPGETPKRAFIREIEEETNGIIKLNPCDVYHKIECVALSPYGNQYKLHIYHGVDSWLQNQAGLSDFGSNEGELCLQDIDEWLKTPEIMAPNLIWMIGILMDPEWNTTVRMRVLNEDE